MLVAGTSGTGKTTLAARVADVLDVPHVEIDALFHGPGWTPRPTFVAEVAEFSAGPAQVTEWQYGQVRPLLAARADLLVWLDLPRAVVMRQVVRRTVVRRVHRQRLWHDNVEPPLRTLLTDPEHIARWAWSTHSEGPGRGGDRSRGPGRPRPDTCQPGKLSGTLSTMENITGPPTPGEASSAIADAEAGRAALAHRMALPPVFLTSIGAAVALQIGTFAVGLSGLSGVSGVSPSWVLVAGFAVLLAVAGGQLVRFRAINGVWLGGLLSRVVGGTATAASVSYAAALAAATWAALVGVWWLVPPCAVVGGVAYALSGRRWIRSYRSEPDTHSRGESAAWLAVLTVLTVLATTGLVLLIAHA